MRSDKARVAETVFGWTVVCEMCHYRDIRSEEVDAHMAAADHNRRSHP